MLSILHLTKYFMRKNESEQGFHATLSFFLKLSLHSKAYVLRRVQLFNPPNVHPRSRSLDRHHLKKVFALDLQRRCEDSYMAESEEGNVRVAIVRGEE